MQRRQHLCHPRLVWCRHEQTRIGWGIASTCLSIMSSEVAAGSANDFASDFPAAADVVEPAVLVAGLRHGPRLLELTSLQELAPPDVPVDQAVAAMASSKASE